MRWTRSSRSLYSTIFLLIVYTSNSFVKYQLYCDDELIIESRKVLFDQVGTLETGQNKGEVEKYLSAVGLKPGNPYCAAGQYYCFLEANKILNKTIPIPRTGLSANIQHHAVMYGVKVKSVPGIDDIIIWRYRKGIHGHTERIIKVGKAGWVETIAFNTKKGNQEGVFKKKRNLYHVLHRMKVVCLIGFNEK